MSLSRLLRIAVAVALTAYVIWQADPAQVARATTGASVAWLGAGALLVLLDRALMAWRWLELLVALTPGSRPPFRDVMRIFFVSTFVGTFLPSVGGDVYRAWCLAQLDVRPAQSAASVLMDRVLGALSIVMVGAAALLAARGLQVPAGVSEGLAIAAAACAVAAAAVFSERFAAAGVRLAERIPSQRVQHIARGLSEAVRRYAAHHTSLAAVLGMSVVVQVLRIVQAYCLGRALGIALGPGVYFVFIPIVLLIMLLPITVNGLGTSQWAFDWLFGQAGVASADAVALSILFVALGVIGNLPGGILYALQPAKPERT